MKDFNLLPREFEKSFVDIIELINKAENILITTHKNPDGDAIGSELALYFGLSLYNKNIRIINCDITPINLIFSSPKEIIEHYDKSIHDNLKFDLIFMLDGNQPNRLGSMEQYYNKSDAIKILIDHHTEPTIHHHISVVNTDATSTGELIFYLLKYLGVDITHDIASNLYMAIMTDTGSFRFPRTTANTHLIIAELLEKGADPVIIYDKVYNTNSISSLHILGLALRNISLYNSGKLSVMKITKDMIIESGATNEDIDNFVNYTLSVAGTIIGIMVAEVVGSDELRISMRSKGYMSVREIAAKFGGGGHLNAAGLRLKNTQIDAAIELLVEETKNILNYE